MKHQTRRRFIKAAVRGGAGLAVLPNILTRSLFGATTPNKVIQVAQIGCGRMGQADVAGVMVHPLARIVAICDLDSKRLKSGKNYVETYYQNQGESSVDIKTYHDYREVLARPDIDAVVVTVPDHWHALVAIEAAIAGKHLYVQKPVTYAVAEAIALRKTVHAKRVILQTGSQQRSEKPWPSFRTASEAVRNGRIGQLQTIKIGIGLDKPSGKPAAPMSVPENLDYDRWLGPAPEQAYMEGRVHPQDSWGGRPGWITTEDFGLGMITNWGAHHVDIAHWAMGQELGGPTTIDAHADFMKNDVWTVHQTYHVELLYPQGVQVVLDNKFETGLRFEGTEGWIFCTRGDERATASDANVAASSQSRGSLRASDPKILSPLDPRSKCWPASKNHYLNWLESIVARQQPIAPIDQSVRSLEACAAAWISMKLRRKLIWNASKEQFVGDDQANAMLERKPRKPEYDFRAVMKKANLA